MCQIFRNIFKRTKKQTSRSKKVSPSLFINFTIFPPFVACIFPSLFRFTPIHLPRKDNKFNSSHTVVDTQKLNATRSTCPFIQFLFFPLLLSTTNHNLYFQSSATKHVKADSGSGKINKCRPMNHNIDLNNLLLLPLSLLLLCLFVSWHIFARTRFICMISTRITSLMGGGVVVVPLVAVYCSFF